MSKLFYITAHTYKVGRGREVNNEPSMTVPNESMTVAQMLKRVMAGEILNQKEGIYFDQEDLDNISRFYAPGLDLTDLDEMRAMNEDIHERILKAQERAQEVEKARIAEEEKKAQEEALKASRATKIEGGEL